MVFKTIQYLTSPDGNWQDGFVIMNDAHALSHNIFECHVFDRNGYIVEKPFQIKDRPGIVYTSPIY